MNIELSPETLRRLELLFSPDERGEAATMLRERCGSNLPSLEDLDMYQLERFRFAALKISNGDLQQLQRALDLANTDWRDLLMAAGFGYDIHAHEKWLAD